MSRHIKQAISRKARPLEIGKKSPQAISHIQSLRGEKHLNASLPRRHLNKSQLQRNQNPYRCPFLFEKPTYTHTPSTMYCPFFIQTPDFNFRSPNSTKISHLPGFNSPQYLAFRTHKQTEQLIKNAQWLVEKLAPSIISKSTWLEGCNLFFNKIYANEIESRIKKLKYLPV